MKPPVVCGTTLEVVRDSPGLLYRAVRGGWTFYIGSKRMRWTGLATHRLATVRVSSALTMDRAAVLLTEKLDALRDAAFELTDLEEETSR